MKSMGEILMMYFSFSLTTSTQEGLKGVQLCNNIGEALRLKEGNLSFLVRRPGKNSWEPKNIRKVPKSTGTEKIPDSPKVCTYRSSMKYSEGWRD